MGKFKNTVKQISSPVAQTHNFIGAPSFSTHNPGTSFWDCFRSDKYASVYPSIKAIGNEFMTIGPFAVNANGKPVKHASVDALYHPNQIDSSIDFFEKLAVMSLTHRKTYILVWRNEKGEAKPGGPFGFKGNNIAGYTFLENPSINRRDGKSYYSIGSQEFTQDDVIELTGGVDPQDLYAGYAPGIASIAWATLDSHMADFQKGFFENGAIPAGQFVITSASTQDYDDTVDKLQESHRGAGKNNNVTYTPRPVDSTGKPTDAKIEWIPFQQANKDIDFKNLFEQVNNRIDSFFGVPASIRGVGENNNYATAQTDQQNFIRFTINPIALRIFTQITHGLNRITGGMGVAITFKLDIPAIADEEKVKAETKSIEANLIRTLTLEGYSLDTVIDAFELSNGYKLLKKDKLPAVIDNDKPNVDDGDEVLKSPDPEKIDGVTPLNLVKAELTDEQKLEKPARKYMKAQVNRVAKEYSDEVLDAIEPDPNEDELELFIAEMMVVINTILLEKGTIQYEKGIDLVKSEGIDTSTTTEFRLTETREHSYQSYMKKVGESYGKDTADSIRKVLNDSEELGWNRPQTEKALKGILNTDEWRVKRLAITESNRSQGLASVDSMKQIGAETGATLEKSLFHSAGPVCEYCRALEGVWKPVDQSFISLGESIEGEDGGILVNDFVDNEGYDPHPNGKGVMIYRVVR